MPDNSKNVSHVQALKRGKDVKTIRSDNMTNVQMYKIK